MHCKASLESRNQEGAQTAEKPVVQTPKKNPTNPNPKPHDVLKCCFLFKKSTGQSNNNPFVSVTALVGPHPGRAGSGAGNGHWGAAGLP